MPYTGAYSWGAHLLLTGLEPVLLGGYTIRENEVSITHMASAMPDLRLPSQPLNRPMIGTKLHCSATGTKRR